MLTYFGALSEPRTIACKNNMQMRIQPCYSAPTICMAATCVRNHVLSTLTMCARGGVMRVQVRRVY